MEDLDVEVNEPTPEEKEVLLYLENNEWPDDDPLELANHAKGEPALDEPVEDISNYMKKEEEEDKTKIINTHIKGIFLVEYHLKRGPEISWSKQNGSVANVDHLALKCMPSGLHHVTSDYCLFVHEKNVALSVAHVDRKESYERGSHIHAIVIVVEDDASLAAHIEFLQEQAAKHPLDMAILESYYDMFNDPKMMQPKTEQDIVLQQMTTQFVDVAALCHRYGSLMFTIWKALLLKQRIIFYQTLPIGRTTSMIQGFVLLLNHLVQRNPTFHSSSRPFEDMIVATDDATGFNDNEQLFDRLLEQDISGMEQSDETFDPKMEQMFTVLPKLLYYVQATDLDVLKTTPFFIATTSDPSIKTFHSDCYDLWIEHGEVSLSPTSHVSQIFQSYGFKSRDILPTPSDKEAFSALNDRLRNREGLVGRLEVLDTFTQYNRQLWRGLTALWHEHSHHGRDPVDTEKIIRLFGWSNPTVEDLRFVQACFLAMRLRLNIFKHHLDHHVEGFLRQEGFYYAWVQYYFCGSLPSVIP